MNTTTTTKATTTIYHHYHQSVLPLHTPMTSLLGTVIVVFLSRRCDGCFLASVTRHRGGDHLSFPHSTPVIAAELTSWERSVEPCVRPSCVALLSACPPPEPPLIAVAGGAGAVRRSRCRAAVSADGADRRAGVGDAAVREGVIDGFHIAATSIPM